VEVLAKIEVAVANTRVLNRSVSMTVLVLLFLCAPNSICQTTDVEISTVDKIIELRGGGRAPWKLRYGLAGSTSSGKINVDETQLARKDQAGHISVTDNVCVGSTPTEV
jgi:hypothetical protein